MTRNFIGWVANHPPSPPCQDIHIVATPNFYFSKRAFLVLLPSCLLVLCASCASATPTSSGVITGRDGKCRPAVLPPRGVSSPRPGSATEGRVQMDPQTSKGAKANSISTTADGWIHDATRGLVSLEGLACCRVSPSASRSVRTTSTAAVCSHGRQDRLHVLVAAVSVVGIASVKLACTAVVVFFKRLFFLFSSVFVHTIRRARLWCCPSNPAPDHAALLLLCSHIEPVHTAVLHAYRYGTACCTRHVHVIRVHMHLHMHLHACTCVRMLDV